ncbi:hypothetical protein C8R45DRAFT_1098692 [Mycena sanguinolenta]|nr:hypothetical protein C8R45DRAFT_1098692 [Mycena sanguinolenta]
MTQWSAETWYMRPWALRELDTVISLEFPSEREELLTRMQERGPIPRDVFGRSDIKSADECLDQAIMAAINKVSYTSWAGDVVVHRVFLITPHEIVDEATGKSREVYVTRLTIAFDAVGIRLAAGTLFENVLHGSLQRGETDSTAVQDIFGVSTVSAAVMLAGEATKFVVEGGKDAETSERPLYLRPFSSTFAAVNSIFITAGAVYLIQCALGESHPFVVKTLLLILHRLDTNLGIDLSKLQLVYCIIGSEGARVKQIVNETDTKLEELKKKVRPKELKGVPSRGVARLDMLVVHGAVFDPVKNTLSSVE